jgi:hypothetical protein
MENNTPESDAAELAAPGRRPHARQDGQRRAGLQGTLKTDYMEEATRSLLTTDAYA